MTRDGDKFTLSTGRTFSANCGYIGLAWSSNRNEWTVSEGYDGRVQFGDPTWEEPEAIWTESEKLELADYMIQLWREFAAKPTR